MARAIPILILVLLAVTVPKSVLAATPQKRILYIASYHTQKDEWTAGIQAGISSVLSRRSDIVLKTHNMDTRLVHTEAEKIIAAGMAREEIGRWRPDLVIISDDNAAKYLLMPFFRDASLPFVFCGLNWDSSVYGLPYVNTTGMVEVQLIGQIVDHLSPYAKGKRIGTLRGDTLTNRKEQFHFEQHLGVAMASRYVHNLEAWKKEFITLQDEVDMLVLGSIRALETGGVPMEEIAAFVLEHTRVPTAAYDEFMQQLALVTLSTIPEEQGQWAAQQAIRILDGTDPTAIPLVTNKKAKRFLNMRLARRLGIRFPVELLESSHLVSASRKKLLMVNSYHEGYAWGDGIEKGLLRALGIRREPDNSLDTSRSEVDVRFFRMNSKLESAGLQIEAAALKASELIASWRPDIVVISDDNAAKYLYQPYFQGSEMPFVFCGINYEAGVYGLPAANATGMIEIEPVRETVEMLRPYAAGARLGYLGADDRSNRKSMYHQQQSLGIRYDDGRLVRTMDEWQREYRRLQETVDMLIILNPVGIRDWNPQEVGPILLANTRIPSGAISDSEVRYALLGNVKFAEEQGWWAGTTALKILAGAEPASIAVSRNQQTRLYLNLQLAEVLGIKLPVELLDQATFVGFKEGGIGDDEDQIDNL